MSNIINLKEYRLKKRNGNELGEKVKEALNINIDKYLESIKPSDYWNTESL